MRLRRILFFFGICLLIAGGWFGWHFWRAKSAVQAYRKQLIAAGERLTVKELLPLTIPDAQNGAEIFRQAALTLANPPKSLLETNPPHAMPVILPGRAMVRWQQPELVEASKVRATNSWSDLGSELSKVLPSLGLLDQLAEKRTTDFNFDYHQGFRGLLPNLAPMKRATQLLGYAAVFSLHEGDPATACNHLRGMLALSRANTEERLAISQLVRFAITAIALNVTWEFLQATNATDEQLAALQHDWQELEFIAATENAMLMVRAISEMTMDDMRESSAEFRNVTSGFGWGGGSRFTIRGSSVVETVQHFAERTLEETKAASQEYTWRVAWSYPDQLRMLQGKQVLIESLRTVRTNKNFTAALTLQKERLAGLGFKETVDDDFYNRSNGEVDLQHLFSSGVQSLEKVINKVLTTEAGRQLVVTAIALKRHQLQHGTLPTTLAALVPEFIPENPIDPVDGQPLRYRLNTDGTFLLYSIGMDGVDNGGDAKNPKANADAKGWQQGRDWVWPQPATTADIKAIQEAEPR